MPSIAGLLAPLRPSRNDFLWSAALTDAFESVKQSLSSAPILSFLTLEETLVCALTLVVRVSVSSYSSWLVRRGSLSLSFGRRDSVCSHRAGDVGCVVGYLQVQAVPGWSATIYRNY